MPRVKFRDFSGGLHLSGHADMQPRNTLRIADGIMCPVQGRLRMAGVPVARFSSTGVTVDGVFRFQTRIWLEGTSAGVHIVRRNNATFSTAFTTITFPAAYGSQAAVALVANSKCTGVFAPPNDGRQEALFLLDIRNTGPNLFKSIDPTSTATTRWGILPLTQADVQSANLVLEPQDEQFIHTNPATDPLEAAGDWTLASGDEDALSGPTALTTETTIAVQGNSLKLVVARDDTAQITRAFGADIDLSEFPATSNPSSDQDYIQFWVRVRRPTRLENLEIAFDTTAAGDFADTFFSRELTFKVVRRRQKRELLALGDLVRVGEEQQFLAENALKPKNLTYDAELGNQQISVAKNTWTRVTIPKASFEKNGNAEWSTVRAIRITCTGNKEGRTAVYLDRLTHNGGVGMVGQYQYTFTIRNSETGTRSNPFITEDGFVINETPLATGAVPAVAERQGVSILFPSTRTFDPQADEFEVWRTVGNGKAYFRTGYITLDTPGTLVAGTEIIDLTSDFIGLNDIQTAEFTQTTNSGDYTGFATLDPTEELPLDNDSPNSPAFAFQDAVGLHIGRMWWTRNVATDDGFGNDQDAQGQVFYSPSGRYEAVQGFVPVTSGATDACQKLTRWNDRLFVHTMHGMYEIVGTDEPFIAHRIEGAPGTMRPGTVKASAEGIFWVSPSDGVYRFNGQFAENISDAALYQLVKLREAVETYPATYDPQEAEIGNNAYWMAPCAANIGNANFDTAEPLLIFDFETRSWRAKPNTRFLYFDWGATVAIVSGPNGQMLGADSANEVLDLEPKPFNTAGQTAALLVKTVATRVGPGQQGVLRTLHIEVDLQGEIMTPALIIDDVTTTLSNITGTGRLIFTFKPNLPGQVFSVILSSASVNNPIEIFGIELDIYVPGETIADSGLAGDR